MTVNISKSTITATTVSKSGASLTWDEAVQTWNVIDGTWDVPGLIATNISKPTVTATKVTKSP